MSKSPDTETVNADPWDVAVPYMKGGFEEAKNLYNQYTPQYYSGQTQAGFSPDKVLQKAMHLLELLIPQTKPQHRYMEVLMVKD